MGKTKNLITNAVFISLTGLTALLLAFLGLILPFFISDMESEITLKPSAVIELRDGNLVPSEVLTKLEQLSDRQLKKTYFETELSKLLTTDEMNKYGDTINAKVIVVNKIEKGYFRALPYIKVAVFLAILILSFSATCFSFKKYKIEREKVPVIEKEKDKLQQELTDLQQKVKEVCSDFSVLLEHNECNKCNPINNMLLCDITAIYPNIDNESEWSISGLKKLPASIRIEKFKLMGLFAHKWLGTSEMETEFKQFLEQCFSNRKCQIEFILANPFSKEVQSAYKQFGESFVKDNFGIFAEALKLLEDFTQEKKFEVKVIDYVPTFRYRQINNRILVADYFIEKDRDGADAPHMLLSKPDEIQKRPSVYQAFEEFFDRSFHKATKLSALKIPTGQFLKEMPTDDIKKYFKSKEKKR